MQRIVKLKRDLHMGAVLEFVGASVPSPVAENHLFFLSQLAKLVQQVLHLNLGQVGLKDDFFASLAVYGDPDEFCFFGDFEPAVVLLRVETYLVHVDDDEFSREPVPDLLI